MAVVIFLSPKTWGHSPKVRFVVMITGVFSELRDEMKEQLAAAFGERQIAQLIKYNQIETNQSVCYFSSDSYQFFLFQLIGQIHKIIELSLGSVSDNLGCDCNGKMSFAVMESFP
jgi:hypothetical protein